MKGTLKGCSLFVELKGIGILWYALTGSKPPPEACIQMFNSLNKIKTTRSKRAVLFWWSWGESEYYGMP